MKFASVVRVSVLGSALAATLAQGYTFSETDDASKESTGLTTNQEDRIFGGSEADASKFPFIVSLREDEANGNTYCGGTLIASQYVVTAGHCVKTDEATIYASIGSAFGSGLGEGQQVKVIEGYRHPRYNKSEHLYDVGVLKLEKEVATKTIDLCAANGSDNEVGTVATARGWGLTENGSQSTVMEEVNVQIISNTECNKMYSGRITEGMLCAGDGDGKDTCNGDSGGPLIANDRLVGIVSWGGKCGVNAGVYTRVSFVEDYIKNIVSGGSGNSFSESSAGSTDKSSSTDTTETPTTTEKPATKTPATETPTTEAPTAAPTTEAPAVATDVPTPVPTTESPVTEAPTPTPTTVSPATQAPETETPSTNNPDQSSPSTDSAEQNENSAQQNEPAPTAAPTEAPTSSSPASATGGKKDCASQL